MKTLITTAMLIGLTIKLTAQIIMSGSLTGHVYSIIDNMPTSSGNDYSNPTLTEYLQWKNLIDTLLNESYTSAASLAKALTYDLVEFTDGPSRYYILQKQDTASNYWGTYVFNPNACRDIVIQSPHPKNDYNTGKQGIYVLKHTEATFYCLAGTHHCNHSSLSTCSGTTTVCDTAGEPFRISDVAHNDSCIFQATTEAIKGFDSTLVFIQLHGFAKRFSDPYVIMSNGTQITPSPDYIDLLKNVLILIDPILDFKIVHQDLTWTRLRGFSNVQGRYINSSSNVCNTDADTTFGTFIHIEQEKTRLRKDSTKWDKMVQAINNTFTCLNTSVSETLSYVNLKLYPNPTSQHATLKFDNPKQKSHTLTLYDSQGRLVRTKTNITTDKLIIDTNNLTDGVYFFQLRTDRQIRATGKLIIK